MAFVYGNSAGPGPSYYRAVIDQSWQDQGDGYYKCCANIRVQVLSGSNFYGTYLKTTWGSEGTLYGPGDSYCFKDLGCKSVPYGGSWTIEGSATYNNHKSTVRHTFAPPKPTYKVNYNANGGYGAPAAQTKTWGTNLTLSGAKPARDGHSFVNWNTRQDGGGTPYNPGSTYTSNSGVTLYAQWSIYKYTITYDANGGWNAPAAQTKNWGSAITLSHSHPTRTNYNFKGWGTSPNASSPAYWAGSSYTANASITLYAIWELAYTQPRIWGVSADRCDSSGTYNEEGTYARVKCSWQTDHTISKVVLWWKKDTDKQWSSMNVPNMSGTSGSVDSIIGNGSFSTEYTYNICIEVNDNTGKTDRYTDIAPLAYIMDVLSSGNGIAFGKPANQENTLDCGYDMLLRKNLKVKTSGGNVITPFSFNDGAVVANKPVNASSFYKERCSGGSWISARDNATFKTTRSLGDASSYYPIISQKSQNGSWNIGIIGDSLYFSYDTDSNYNNGVNATSHIRIDPVNTAVYSNTLGKMLNMNDIDSFGKCYWRGAAHMNGSQTISFSNGQYLSQQIHGWVLVWSFYSDSTGAKDEQFSMDFVHKDYVRLHEGSGITFNLCSSFQNAVKYLYIRDTNIKGNDVNGGTKALDGITYTNGLRVLRYVLGV